jgi:hypothetical protein
MIGFLKRLLNRSINLLVPLCENPFPKYGSDIFVTYDESFYFDIIDNNIFTISWDGRKYKFNYDDGEDE